MKKQILHSVGLVFSVFLFATALLIINSELKEYHLQDILYNLKEIPAYSFSLAILLTILNYIVLTGYDTIAFRYIRHQLKYSRIAIASFISYSISNNMGIFMLSGAPIRYRLYSAWGVSGLDITKIVVFCSLSLWMGFFTLGGFVFIFEPFTIPLSLSTHFTSVRTIGAIFLMVPCGYLLTGIFLRKRSLKIWRWKIPLVPIKLSFVQLTLASLDWALLGSVLYVLLPPDTKLSYPEFMGIFMLAQFLGVISNVPGGLGIFESVIIILLSSFMHPAKLLGSLLAYRTIYYILPMIISAIFLGTFEIVQRTKKIDKTVRIFGRWITAFTPHVLTFTVFSGGVILLVSGATPALKNRLALLAHFIPLPVLEVSHFLGSLVGAGLIILAQGLQRRLYVAYVLTLILLGSGAVFSLLKGFDYEEAITMLIIFCSLLPAHRYFYRKASLIGQRFTPGWTAAISSVLICTAWLGFFSYKHIEYSDNLWWQFAITGDAPRFLRAAVGTTCMLLFFAAAKLLRPVAPEPSLASSLDMEKARDIAATSPNSLANLALLGDKAILFSESGNSFIMYGVEGSSWIAMGDPIGQQEEISELAWRFRELSDRHNGLTAFYEVGTENMHIYADLGLTFVKLGEEGRVLLETFSLEGREHKDMRYILNKLDKGGCSFEIITKENIPVILPELKEISDAWLAAKNTREKRFSLGFFNEEYLKQFPVAIVKREEKIIAFANIWPGNGKDELSIDLMRHISDAPNGIMDYLFINLILQSKHEGYKWFNLGMAPLSGLEDHALAPLWSKLGAFVFRHGEHFYNCQGLRHYKDKFGPEWKPKYLACPGGLSLPRILANIASLISRGLTGVFIK